MKKNTVKQADIVLIQSPGWSVQNPPMGLALLKSYLSSKGFNARVMDLNIVIYNLRQGRYERAWEDANGYYTWERFSYINDMYEDYAPEILNFIYSVLLHKPRVIGFSGHCSTAASVKLLAEKFRLVSPEIKIVLGGPQFIEGARIWRELFADNLADAVVFGEGEETLVEYLTSEDYDRPVKGMAIRTPSGEVLKGERRELIRPLDSLPFADYSDFDLSQYEGKNVLPTYFSRGCINRCIYCTENKFFPKFRNRTGKRVFDEVLFLLSKYPETKYFRMHDSVSNGNINELEKFCELLIEKKVRISFNLENAVIRKEMTPQLYKKLKMAGCNLIGYGLETPSKRLLKSIGKNLCLDADFDKVIENGASAGITIGVNMMFGLPGESEDDWQAQLKFLEKHYRNRKRILINPALNFCYLPEGCEARESPHKFGIDISGGELFWSADCGLNNFENRMAKFEQFCLFAEKLGYANLFGITKNLNKNEMLGRYWQFLGNFEKALEYFGKSFKTEEKTIELAHEIIKLYHVTAKTPGVFKDVEAYLIQVSVDREALWQSIKNKDELNRFIACFERSDVEARLKKYSLGNPMPALSITWTGIKNWIKFILEKLHLRENKRKCAAFLEIALFAENKTIALHEVTPTINNAN